MKSWYCDTELNVKSDFVYESNKPWLYRNSYCSKLSLLLSMRLSHVRELWFVRCLPASNLATVIGGNLAGWFHILFMWHLVCLTLSRYNLHSQRQITGSFCFQLWYYFRGFYVLFRVASFSRQKPQLGPKLLMQTLQITYEEKHAKMEECCKLQAQHCQVS